ncbi:FadR/GntR family transcriptional regulator [Halomonas dongshanensis]|uniref:FCD domain-containing protein n=1 Tax=Halomonas dongshanensis TaxID=2890835 RepID=A0ABT2E9M7_9GAMM|nr:FCD domain-containing protein [Halomonas dongshanensis]
MAATSSKASPRPRIDEYLVKDIFGGRYRPGDMVPREIDLCEQFAINRSAVRSDLRQLVEAGILERISGHGSRVREYAEWRILDPQVTAWLTRYASPNPLILKEILAFRLDVEPYVAMTAAKRATARDLLAIEDAFEGMGQNLSNAAEEDERRLHSECDIAFHEAIFKATHNIVWAQLSHILRPSIFMTVSMSNRLAMDSEESLERHRVLMESIRLRRPREAFKAAEAVLAGTGAALGLEYSATSLGRSVELPTSPPDTFDE